MGVYIYMEMPHDGRYTVCVTHDSHGVVHWVFQNQDTLEFIKHGAVTEVPEPHGRFGDLDALKDKWTHKDLDLFSQGWSWLRDLNQAPTIIPASEEGET